MVILTPDDARDTLLERLRALKCVNKRSDMQSVAKYLCASNIFFWLEHYCFTFDPRPDSLHHLSFIPYPFQKDLINQILNSIRSGDDILIEKSRDMGVTWCVLYVFQWLWQFHSGYNLHIGSKKQDNVDVIGDPATLFGKLRYNLRMQPKWLLPKGFSMSKHSHLLKILNPETGNTITGESSNPDFSRSGRYSAVLFDEFAFWNNDYEAWTAAGDSTTSRIAVSTPFGKFNKFADLRFNSSIKVLTLHWKQHPLKSDLWYQEQLKRRTSDEIARELDINYLLSVEGRVYKDFNYATHVRVNIEPDKDLPIIRTWDFGLNPAVIFSQIDDKGRWKVLDEVVPDNDTKPTISEFIPQVLDFCKKNYSNFDFKDICDIAGKQRSSHSGKTDIDWLISFGISPLYNLVKIEEGISLVASRLICKDFDPEPAFLLSTRCKRTIEAFAGAYRRKKPSVQGQETPPAQEHPYEDVMDCIRYTAWQYFDAHKRKKPSRRSRLPISDNPLTGY